VTIVASSAVVADGGATTLAAVGAPAAVLADGRATTLATLGALSAVLADGRAAALAAMGALTAVGALVSLSLRLLSCVTLQARLEASAEAVHLVAILKEALLTSRTLDCLLCVVHCDTLLVSVY
jgi:hypothetical protein